VIFAFLITAAPGVELDRSATFSTTKPSIASSTKFLKTRFAQRLAETLGDAKFIGLDRIADSGVVSHTRLDEDPALNLRVERAHCVQRQLANARLALHGLFINLVQTDFAAGKQIELLSRGLEQRLHQQMEFFRRAVAAVATRTLSCTTPGLD